MNQSHKNFNVEYMVNLEDLPHSSTESKGDHPNCSTCINAGKQLCSTMIRLYCGTVLVHEKKTQ